MSKPSEGHILIRTTPALREALRVKAYDAHKSLSAFLLDSLKTIAEK